jgi:hypothetical protein
MMGERRVMQEALFYGFSRICRLQILGVTGNSWNRGQRLVVRSGR